MMHFPGGIGSIVITGLIGLIFALSRIAGMPIIVLIIVHAVIDFPNRLPKEHFETANGNGETIALGFAVVLAVMYHFFLADRNAPDTDAP